MGNKFFYTSNYGKQNNPFYYLNYWPKSFDTMNTLPTGLSILGKFYIGPVMVLGYCIFKFKS